MILRKVVPVPLPVILPSKLLVLAMLLVLITESYGPLGGNMVPTIS
jgi:hypothetical protein